MMQSFLYKAFGLYIQSDMQLVTLPRLADDSDCSPQVTVHRLDAIPDFPDGPTNSCWYQSEEQRFDMYVEHTGGFSVQNGNAILITPCDGARAEHLFLYIMGTCMGMLLYQRGHLLMHGSCVCRDDHAILITGNSEAGKSTLAATFINHGWKLLTDDLADVTIASDCVTVQSSYPSQKLWQDGINHFDIDPATRHPLWQEQRREKFTVVRPDIFMEGTARLSQIAILEAAADGKLSVTPVTGFTAIGQWMKNAYRRELLTQSQKQVCFQQCINASRLAPMVHIQRTSDWQCLESIYQTLAK